MRSVLRGPNEGERVRRHRVRNAALVAGVSAYALLTSSAIGDPAANAPSFTQTTAGAISTTVPDGVCAMRASATGGSGASSGTTAAITGGRGAGGAIIGATFRVLPGQSVTGAVGGGGTVSLLNGGTSFGGTGTAAGGNGGTVTGSPWHRGGGGGGSSSISVGGVKLVEAGGGGGGGGAHQNTPTGDGGSGGFAGIGAGIVAVGVTGTAGFQAAGITVGAGQGGQAAAGGAGGVHSATLARNGFAGLVTGAGGNGGPDNGVDSGGGGGGGFTGGGGGAATQGDSRTGGGGGGGSSFVRATSPTVSATAPSAISGSGAAQTGIGAANGAAGAVTIDWVPCIYQLSVAKSASPSPVNAGARTVWTVSVTNNGPDPMTKGDTVTLTDTLPSGPIGSPTPTFRVLSIGTSGGSNADMTSGAMTCTGVTVGSSMPSSTVCSRPYSAPSAPGAPGAPGDRRGLNSGETLTITYEQVFTNATAAATITNTASTVDRSSTSGTTDIVGVTATRSANASVTVTPYNLAVTKTRSAATANPGDTLTWTVQVTNNGPGNMEGPDETAANPLIVTETPPPANVSALSLTGSSGAAGACTYASPTVTCPAGLPAGQTQTLTFQQTVNAGVVGGTTITNGAAVTDFVTGDTNDSASATVTVNPTADLAVTKSNGVASVAAGGTTSYTVTVTNNGPTSVTGATLTDAAVAGLSKTSVSCSGTPGQCTGGTTPSVAQLEAGYALPALASGQTYQITVAANVTATSGSVANVATIAPPSGTTDPTGGNNTATDTDSVTPVADLAITKTNGASSVGAGGSTNYTITVTNNGPSGVTGATITDAAAAGLSKTAVACSGTPGQCTGGTTPSIAQLEAGYALPALASGQTYQIIVSASVTAAGGSVANTATIAPPSGTADSTPGNDSATDTDTVTPAADLAITKTNGASSVTAGGTTTYTVTVTNNGPSPVTGATITDAAVAGLAKSGVACSGTPGQCTVGTTPSVAQLEAGYALPALASGQTYQLTVAANVTAASGSVANTATIAPPSGTTDPSSGNDTATDTDTVTEVANLVTVKTLTSGNATPSAGDTVTFQIAVTNNGPSGATNVTLTDTLPAGLTAAGGNGTASQGTYTPGTGVWAVGALANGATATLTLAGTVNAGQGGNTITNTTTAASTPDQTDPTTSGDDLSETVNVFLPVIDAENDAGTVANGANGGVAVANVLVNDTLNGVPATLATIALTQVSTTNPNVTLNPATGAVSVAPATPAGTYTVTYQICEQLNPTNCDTATVTVTVGAAPIDAVNDDYSASPVNGASGGNTASVLANDTLNGGAVTVGVGGNVTLTPGAAPTPAAGSIAMNADGTITVAVGATAGTYSYPYTICEVLNPTNCDTATATVVVSAAPIDAVDDAGTVANGANGGVAVANVLVNDTLNGVPATLATIALSQVSTTSPNVTLNPATGAVSVAAATPAGTYAVTYQICEQLNPTNCDTATVTVTVGAAPIDAVDDAGTVANGANGGVAVANVLVNDMLNGVPATLATITLTQVSTTSPNVTPNPATGSVNVAPATPAGTYTVVYQICEQLNPTNCDTATVTVTVGAAPIDAVDDDYSASPINGASGGATASVLANDTLNGGAVTVGVGGNSTLTPGAAPTPAAGSITMNADGTITVAAGTTAGTYSYPYTICEVLNPTNCDAATATVVVSAAPIDAVDDTGTVANGANGGVAVANVLVNDTLNGVPATLATITLSQVSTTSPNVTLNPATGAVSVAPATPAGTYTVTYQICEQLNPTNCDTATVTVTVGAAPIDAVNDDYSASPINGANGGSTASVLANDTLNGGAATVGVGGNVTLTPGAAPTPAAGSIAMNADGTITVAAGTTAGTYSYPYTICEVLNPTNCDAATATVVVSAAPINANDDDYSASPVNGANGGSTASVLTNDTLNGGAVTVGVGGNVTLTPGAAPTPAAGSITMNADGTITVAAGTTAGTYSYPYTICEVLNPTNCDAATATVVVSAAPINAVDDDYSASPINGASGGSTASVLANDTLNGAAVTVGVGGNSTLTPGAAPTPAAGSLTMNADGTITVAAGTTAGTYSYPYTICELLNPTNCDTATATVVVSAAPIVATADSGTVANGANGGVAVANVLVNDTLNGVPATLASVTLNQVSTTSPNVTLTPATGEVNVAPGTPAGTYTVAYQICEQLNPSNCSTTTVTVTVGAAVIDAVNDDYSASPINGASGGSTASVLANDTLNGAAVTVGVGGNSTLTPGAAPTPAAGSIMMNADGTITVAAGTTAGTYSYSYTICEVLNPTNCDTATATVVVSAAPIVATNDTPAAVTNGIGSANLINAFANDTLNGAPVNVSAITASVTVPASNPGVALDPLTGIVSVAPSVPAGDYTIQYQICELINPTNCSSATISVHVDPAVSALSGTVYSDVNGNGTLDSGEPRRANWIVEVYRNGLLVQTTNSDSQGDYQFTGLLSGSGYSIHFVNPENNVVYNVIDNLTLPDNATLADQNQPIDPSGVVYDSVSRLPVAGAIVTMVDAGGTALPGACFVSATQQGQTTGASGQYQFDIVPGAAAQCPVGETLYRLVVTPPGGYSAPSTVLTPLAGPFDPTGLPSPVAIGANGNPPAVGDATPYYFTFRLASGDAHVIFNHIPVDPFLTRTPLVVTKTSIKRTASVGDLVPYTVTVRNTEAAQRAGVNVVDILPPGFKYVPGSALVNGVAAEPVVADRELTWTNQVIPANGANVYKLTLVVGAGVTGGDRINTGLARNGADNSEISNRGQAVVSIVASTVFDCSEIIGKVFDDRDGDGYQDEGEPGIAAARLATVNGLLATTDEFGRYHITCVAVPNAFIGSNFVLKLDPRSVPAGFAPTSDNPQSIRLTRGKTSELNFGVKRAEVRQVNLDGRAFDGNDLKGEFASKLGLLVPANGQAVVIRVTYRLSASEDAAVAEVRAGNVKSLIEAAFAAHPDKAAPEIETNVIRADGAQRGE